VGNGNQMMSWVHVDDVAHFILYAIQHANVQGIYNVSAPEEIDNRAFSKILAHTLKRPHILPAVPAWILKMMFGEMSKLVLQGRNLNSHKILASGFQFTYTSLQSALSNLLQKKV
jgi:NAD dependent epimerase/dehydratase family enzyme